MTAFLAKFSPYRKTLAAILTVLFTWSSAYLRNGFGHVGFDGWMWLAGSIAGVLGVYSVANAPLPVPVPSPTPTPPGA